MKLSTSIYRMSLITISAVALLISPSLAQSIYPQEITSADLHQLRLEEEKEEFKKESNTGTEVKEDSDLDSLAVRVELKPISTVTFDTFLIPCTDIYDFTWDSLNVDVTEFKPATMDTSICIQLTESDCGFHHPHLGEINSDFGWRRYRMHHGIDVDLEIGDTIYAAFDGVVRISKVNPNGYGNYVMLRHYNGLETLYGHLSKRLVEPNQFVRAGEVIGLGGNTGRSTGPHLHFEVRYKGKSIDPKTVINFDSGALVSDTLVLEKTDFQHVINAQAYAAKYGSKVYYRVRSGDNLWRISRRYGTSVSRICRLNGISSSQVLRVGQTLRIR